MSGNSKLLLGFLAGAAAGAALAVLLSSDRGKEILQDIRESASEFEDDLKAAMEKGRQMIAEMEEKVRHYRKPAES